VGHHRSLSERTFIMQRAHRRYLVEQAVGSGIFNFFFNAILAYVWFLGDVEVPLWGEQSIGTDVFVTCFMLPFSTCVMLTPMVRRHLRNGKVPSLDWDSGLPAQLRRAPQAMFKRAFVFGALGVLVVSPLVLLPLAIADISQMAVADFALFKGVFALIFGAAVTPVFALWTLATPASPVAAQRAPAV
jgi:hypothetical protein